MNKIMRLAILFSLIFISVNINAQTFKCTDYKFSEEYTEYEKNKVKTQTLGVTLELEFFKNDVKVYYNIPNEKPTIFNKKGKDEYQFSQGKRTEIIKLNKLLGFIKSIEYSHYENENWKGTAILERKFE